MSLRMSVVILALAGVFVATYLYLYKIGAIGVMVCGTGACETVQLSPQSRFLGVEVSLIGIGGYVTLLLLGLASLQPRFAGRSGPLRLLLVLSGVGLVFTAYLTYLELFVIHAICRWCVGSAVIIALIFLWDAGRLAALGPGHAMSAPGAHGHARPEPTGKQLAALSLAALGVVYGDIGTSPLYAIKECFDGTHRSGSLPTTSSACCR